MVGTVLSTKMDKTAVVKVQRLVKHPQYHKYVRRSKKYKVHDEKNRLNVGDKVLIAECRPLSREKRWTLKQVLGEAGT